MHIATRIVVFLVIVNSSAAAIDASGVAEDWGVNPNPGMDNAVSDLNQELGNIDPSSGLGDTLFAMYTSVTKTFQILFNFIFYGPIMFQNLGVPSWLTGLVFAPQYIISGTAIGYSLFGRRI